MILKYSYIYVYYFAESECTIGTHHRGINIRIICSRKFVHPQDKREVKLYNK